MAIYCVTYSEDDDWGTTKDRFKTRRQADQCLEEARATGRFARLIRWQDGHPTEVERVNEGGTRTEPVEGEVSAATGQTRSSTPVVGQTAPVSSPSLGHGSSDSSSGVPSRDPQARLQLVKLVLEIIAIALTIIGGIVALIWKSHF